jgi:tetratricopeptide (TPR) repeat protein
MGTRFSLAAFILCGAFAASDVSAQVVSVDQLRHPITAQVRPLLLRAMEKMESGDHETAIAQLREMLTKYPDSAAYALNLLGVEYVKTDRYDAAVSSFEQAVLLLPHDAMTHYNFGLALVCARDYDRATQEVQRALKLDPRNPKMQARLNALLERQRASN